MKLSSIVAPILLAVSGSSIASPAPNPNYVTLSNTAAGDDLLVKRAPTGTLSTWVSASSAGCTGTPGQTITNPTSGQCYTHGSGTPQTFRRAAWGGNNCNISFYTSNNCAAGTLSSSATSGAICWSGSWQFLSFKLVC
ncbi:hypothetical protein QBC36DRAFT_178091 [Triangularia setosa]|uniref:Uncharacterized protein n=1 Tax=Triangularia setosa TaxID=2587417 RepID=A0AAN6WE93_9PEZI|nr:hypothetical protein QBC36DRAFT_178091 [Podospora setosa]